MKKVTQILIIVLFMNFSLGGNFVFAEEVLPAVEEVSIPEESTQNNPTDQNISDEEPTSVVEEIDPILDLIEDIQVVNEEETPPATDETEPSEEEESSTDNGVVIQETVPGDVLETTVNPNTEEVAVEEETEIEDVLENDNTEIPPEEEIPTEETLDEENTTDEEDVPLEEVIIEEEIIQPDEIIPLEALLPKKDYFFSISNQKISVKKDTELKKLEKPQETKNKSVVNSDVMVSSDVGVDVVDEEEPALLNVSGGCSDKYYVVLLYKNKEDYDKNPASYILNKAYLCENNNFDYDIETLPKNLQNGTYHLLIAGMGDVGTWSPISSLTPINITRNE